MHKLLTAVPALAAAAALIAALQGCAQPPAAAGAGRPPETASGQTEVQWLGQSTFRIRTSQGRVIVTDPWLRANPITPPAYKDLAALGKVDVLLVTHGHADHFADAPELARMNNIPVHAPGDMNQVVGTLGILPPAQLPRFNKSGTVEPVPGIRVTAVHAEHSSVLVWRNPATQKDEAHYAGEPVGYLIELENGFRIWHMGDTGLFGDMKFIADYYRPDLVLMPIGGNFTMDPKDAGFAVREWVHAKTVIPMHYGANPLAKGTAPEFVRAAAGSASRILVLQPGEKQSF